LLRLLADNFSFNCSNYGDDSGYDCQDNSTEATFVVTQGKRYRFRLINVGAFGEFQFSVDNHTITVIEADSTLVEPVTIHRLPINIAQRYSVILTANQTATNYWIRAWMNTYCMSTDNAPVLNPAVKALLTYTNTTYEPTESVDWADAVDIVCEDLVTATLAPANVTAAPAPDVAYTIDVAFQIGAYALDLAYINGTTWSPEKVPTLNQAVAGLHAGNSSFSTTGLTSAFGSSQFVIDVPEYQVVDLLINSEDEGSHPFHLHGHQFWILASSAIGVFDWNTYKDLNTTNPMRRDTLTINAYGWALIRFKADNPGLWALHCHISWHMEAGLLMQFQTRDDIMKDWTIPSDVLALCNNTS
jgi:FtsP/CotA-like multicopper oxidase with cupredoxin domain